MSREPESKYIDDHHAEGRNEEKLATANFVTIQRGCNGNDPAPNSKSAVDFELSLLVRDADLIQDFGEIV
jgi:hypothetical protein